MVWSNSHTVIIGLGSNLPGAEMTPRRNIAAAIEYLRFMPNVTALQAGRLYESGAVGPGKQNNYINTTVKLETSLSPFALLRALKRIEESFGRRGFGVRWSGRILDLDIIDWKGRIINWRNMAPGKIVRGGLILPHAHAHSRDFVLRPLLDVQPGWVHPVFKIRVQQLLDKLDKSSPGQICKII